MGDASDLRLYDRYKKYLNSGALDEEEEKRGGTVGTSIMDEVIKRAGGVSNVKHWLRTMEFRKMHKEKTPEEKVKDRYQ
jgi:hypothetical protein